MADLNVVLDWTGNGDEFRGGLEGGPQVTLDSSGVAGPSPVVALVLALGGCMAIDVLDIARKSRVPITSLRLHAESMRAAEPPRRLTSVKLRYVIGGVEPTDEPKLQRAIDLSRDKYCSVLHSMKDDIALEIELVLQ